MFTAHFSTFQQMPQGFAPFPATTDKPAWDALPLEARAKLIQWGDVALSAPWPTLSATDYLDFTRTGRRIPFENKYFGRRHLLNDLVVAECVSGQGRYLDAITDAVWAICEESGWQLPPHNVYVRDGAQNPLPDPNRPVLDLFACETAASLALVYHLLGENLEAVVPGVTKRILSELTHRIITPYLSEHFWWMGDGDEPMCNWTPWCTQNVLLVAAITPQPDDVRMAICKKAAYGLDCFVKDYDDDGGCDEGAKYYGHAALCLFVAMEVLNGMTDGHFAPLYETEKIRNMADFIRRMHVAGDYYINFADCPAILTPPGALEFGFGRRTKNAALAAFAAEGARQRGLHKPSGDLSLYTRLITYFFIDEISQNQDSLKVPPDCYFVGAGVLVARDSRICLAVKSGDNDDNHNHNDVGSITLYIDGEPFLIDVGVGSYTRDTFSPRRYEIWTMQSAYHNLPTFSGIMQQAGMDYKAGNVQHRIGDDETSISMDIGGAYPKDAGVARYQRNVRLEKGRGVFITDVYEGQHPAELSLMFCHQPIIEGRIIMIDGVGQITAHGTKQIHIEEIAIEDDVLRRVWGDKLYRALISFSDKIELEIIPNNHER